MTAMRLLAVVVLLNSVAVAQEKPHVYRKALAATKDYELRQLRLTSQRSDNPYIRRLAVQRLQEIRNHKGIYVPPLTHDRLIPGAAGQIHDTFEIESIAKGETILRPPRQDPLPAPRHRVPSQGRFITMGRSDGGSPWPRLRVLNFDDPNAKVGDSVTLSKPVLVGKKGTVLIHNKKYPTESVDVELFSIEEIEATKDRK